MGMQDHRWTEADNQLIYSLRALGETWASIAIAIGVSEGAVSVHAQHAKLRPLAPVRVAAVPARLAPLPAGHSESWGAITAGTWLEGEPWPGGPVVSEGEERDEDGSDGE